MTTQKKRFAVCGLSTRGIYHFMMPMLGQGREGATDFSPFVEIVGVLDIDRERADDFMKKTETNFPFYRPEEIERMIDETKPDTLIVVGPDGTHCDQAIVGLKKGCDVIIEKPMVINCEQARRLKQAEEESGKKVHVAFNYRYTPTHQRLKRMIQSGELGKIINIEFTYNLDTWHGSSYFYRWNRRRHVSGGLNIHKCCHHFDLINWWLGDDPVQVYAMGGLNYYGPNGAIRPRDTDGQPLDPIEEKRQCPVFKRHYADKIEPDDNNIRTGWDRLRLPMNAQYPLDQRRYIYDDEIIIEDTYNAVVRYKGGTTMSYSCNFCTPWEGYVLGINGTKGRVEIKHRSDPDPTGKTNPASNTGLITFYPLFGGRQDIEIPAVAGSHGGADFVSQNDLILEPSDNSRELSLVAGIRDGTNAVAIGEAVARSIKTQQPIDIPDLIAGKLD